MTKNSSYGREPNKKYGHCRTDPDSWFTKGCKPGPGRPKGRQNRAKLYRDAMNEKVSVPKKGAKGGTAKMSKEELKYHQLANKAAKGDLKAIQMTEALNDRYAPADPAPPTEAENAANLRALDYYVDLQQRLKITAQAEETSEQDGGQND